MKTPSIWPIIIMIVMWINIFHSLFTSEPILWWEWIVTVIYTILACTYVAYHLKNNPEQKSK